MYYSQLSELNQSYKFSNEDINALDEYLHTLPPNVKDNITATKLANHSQIHIEHAINILAAASKLGVLKQSFSIVCPECGFHIERVESITDIPETKFCYNCEQHIVIDADDIEVKYEIVAVENFCRGQRKKQTKSPGRYVDPKDSLKALLDSCDNLNEIFYQPTEDDYKRFKVKLNQVYSNGGTKEKGDHLEELLIDLFNIAPFSAASVKTKLNQIDCYVRNCKFISCGIFNKIGSRYVIECKNEEKTPSGTYISKLQGIISEINGREGKHVYLGIIASKKKAPSTYFDHAKIYHAASGVSVIAICVDEIEKLIDNRGNLLELIERKVDEIALYTQKSLNNFTLYDN